MICKIMKFYHGILDSKNNLLQQAPEILVVLEEMYVLGELPSSDSPTMIDVWSLPVLPFQLRYSCLSIELKTYIIHCGYYFELQRYARPLKNIFIVKLSTLRELLYSGRFNIGFE